MNTRLKILSSISLLTFLSACSSTTPSVTGNAVDYQSAQKKQTQKTLEVPPDLISPVIADAYAIPQRGSVSAIELTRGQAQQHAMQSKASPDVLKTVEGMKIERAGNQRWLVVQKSPEELWSILEEFWQDNGFLIAQNAPNLGILETDWAENRAKLPMDGVRSLLSKVGLDNIYSTPERDRFRTRLERGKHGTEIYITHRGVAEIYSKEGKDQTVWQPRPSDPELEAEFLGRLMLRLGATEEKARQALQSPKHVATPRTHIEKNTLTLNDQFDRAWRRTGLALDRVGLSVVDRNRSEGIYFVRPVEQEHLTQQEQRGFFSRLAFWRDEPSTKQEDTLKSVMHLKLTERNDRVTLQFLDDQGQIAAQNSQYLNALERELR